MEDETENTDDIEEEILEESKELDSDESEESIEESNESEVEEKQTEIPSYDEETEVETEELNESDDEEDLEEDNGVTTVLDDIKQPLLKPLSIIPLKQEIKKEPAVEVIEVLPAVFDIRLMHFEEIQEINKYVSTSIPYSVLQQLFILAEAPLSKAKIFTAVYRIVYSARNAAASQNTKNKLDLLLNETKDAYDKIFTLLMNYEHTNQVFNHHRYMNKIIAIFCDVNTNLKINKLIDAFLVFAEKQELYDINKILGLDLETDSGKKILTDIMTGENVRTTEE